MVWCGGGRLLVLWCGEVMMAMTADEGAWWGGLLLLGRCR